MTTPAARAFKLTVGLFLMPMGRSPAPLLDRGGGRGWDPRRRGVTAPWRVKRSNHSFTNSNHNLYRSLHLIARSYIAPRSYCLPSFR